MKLNSLSRNQHTFKRKISDAKYLIQFGTRSRDLIDIHSNIHIYTYTYRYTFKYTYI